MEINKKYAEIFVEDKKGRTKSFYLKKKNSNINLKLIIDFLNYFSKKFNQDTRVCFHKNYKDKLQDMILIQHYMNFYKPHKHLNGYDTYNVIDGKLGVVTFNDYGKIKNSLLLKKNNVYKTPTNMFHVTIPISKKVIYHEYKSGKFNRKTNCIFPQWCPRNLDQIKEFKKKLKKKIHEKS